ncbi:serine/threonine protein kinase [Paenibacillus sp. 1P07SE]|uniref:serine/threonine protein kinase n=1 Tax=Paenibacillus sp. 1P07SE TaxID=3132209 RepID=UPI0039A44A07
MATSVEPKLARDTVITGKWKQNRYRIERLLGEGANGRVYLVERGGAWYAFKVGSDAVDLQSEVNVLKSLAQHQRGEEVFLVDVDDYRGKDGKEHPFYVMRYVRGLSLLDYLNREGTEWFPLVGFHLLNKLAGLHASGWVFGDLKLENVLVGDYGRAQLVDYGGVSAIGKSVRQFTEIYDRGYWSAGSRTADPQYDLFSYAVLCIQLFESKRLAELTRTLLPQNRVPEELMKLTQDQPALKPFAGWLRKALHGGYADTREAAAAWQRLAHRPGSRRRSAAPRWMRRLLLVSALLFAASMIWLIRTGL